MRRWFPSRWICAAVLALSVFALLPKPIAATHKWGNYHWARTSAAIKIHSRSPLALGELDSRVQRRHDRLAEYPR